MNAMTQDIDTLLQKTKGNLFFQKGSGFLGALLCKLNFKWDSSIPTAQISATTLYWNPEWFLSLSPEMRITVLAHEIWHNAMLHIIRRGDRCPKLWNIAGDHVINNLLEDHGYVFEGPCCKDPKYKGWSTDEVYDDLKANGGSGGGQPDPTFGTDIKESESKEEIETAISNAVSAMATARITNSAGDIPGEITQVIDQFLNPRLPWEVILFNFFNELTTEEYSYARPNRRYDDPLMPGQTGRNGLEHLVYMVDASGSMTEEQEIRAHTEVKYIQERLRPQRLSLVVFDTAIRSIQEYEIDEPYDKIEFNAGGGTDLKDCWKYLAKERPTAAVVISDLWVNIPENPGIPIIWVCVDNPDAKVPYGQLIHLPE